jgi:2-(1,2-epoxy-1,2-dihydrophenyl)acetyl-CoA isomerase
VAGAPGGGAAVTGHLLTSTRDGVTEIRLNRPGRRNALSTELLRELRGHLVAVADDPDVRVVILAGAGEAFCAGVDLHEIPPGAPARRGLARWRLVAEVLQRLRELEQPTLAAVNGPAVGAGWGLALACDLCFAVAGASFWLPEVTKGFRLPGPLSSRLVEVAGPVRAAEVMFGGQSYQAADALAAGWVTRVLPGEPELAAQVREFAATLAAAPRQAVAAAKLALRPGASGPFPPPQFGWTDD